MAAILNFDGNWFFDEAIFLLIFFLYLGRKRANEVEAGNVSIAEAVAEVVVGVVVQVLIAEDIVAKRDMNGKENEKHEKCAKKN